jgi:hypothetical protein
MLHMVNFRKWAIFIFLVVGKAEMKGDNMNNYLSFLTITCFCLIGCTITDRAAKVTAIGTMADIPHEFIMTGNLEYQSELAIACAERGIKIKPIALRHKITEIEADTRISQYNEAGFRYAINVSIRHDHQYRCFFSHGHFVDVTLAINDIHTNETLLIIKQRGPESECPPLTPVWDLLADELQKQLTALR